MQEVMVHIYINVKIPTQGKALHRGRFIDPYGNYARLSYD